MQNDCGLEIAESPALRGFVGGLRALATAALYLVLLSNGLPYPKIWLKKFDFSPIDTPANIAKKLPSQRCFKPLFIASFNFSHKRRNVRFKGLQRVHTRLCSKDRTQRLTRRNRGLPSLDHSAALCRQRNTLYSATLLYTYISRFSVNHHYQQMRKIRQSCRHSSISDHLSSCFSTSPTNGPHLPSLQKAGTHSPSPIGSHTSAYTAKQGAFRTGALLLPSERSTRFGNSARPGVRTANFAAFGSWPGALSKNAEGLRDSDALMRVAVPRRRGPAGLRRPTPPAERTVPAPISPRVQLCLRRPAFPLSAFIPGA